MSSRVHGGSCKNRIVLISIYIYTHTHLFVLNSSQVGESSELTRHQAAVQAAIVSDWPWLNRLLRVNADVQRRTVAGGYLCLLWAQKRSSLPHYHRGVPLPSSSSSCWLAQPAAGSDLRGIRQHIDILITIFKLSSACAFFFQVSVCVWFMEQTYPLRINPICIL